MKRSNIRQARERLYPISDFGPRQGVRKLNLEAKNQPRGPRLTPAEKAEIKKYKNQVKRGRLAKKPKIRAARQPNSTAYPVLEWYYDSNFLYFDSDEYVDDLDELFYTYYAPYGTQAIQVDFSWIDLESGFDKVEIYDRYGLCKSYSGYWGHVTSSTCYGDYVQIWIKTDSSISGEDYDGFQISGFYYQLETYNYTPVAIISANQYTASTRTSIYFSGLSSYDPEDSILNYSWDFGDGGSSTSSSPSHTYSHPGTYLVSLTVTDNHDLTDTDYVYISVFQAPPQASFSLSRTTFSLSNPARLTLDGNSQASSLEIGWGDGTTTFVSSYSDNRETFTHTYSATGVYAIVVKAFNSAGADTKTQSVTVLDDSALPPSIAITNLSKLGSQSGRTYKFAPTVSYVDDGSVTHLDANWGGGEPLNGVQDLTGACPRSAGVCKTNHIYRESLDGVTHNKAGVFGVIFTAVDNTNVFNQAETTLVTKNSLPKIKNLTTSCSGPVCQVGVAAATDADGYIASYTWDFFTADGGPLTACPASAEATASCTFPAAGTYVARLTVTDNLGAFIQKSKKIRLRLSK